MKYNLFIILAVVWLKGDAQKADTAWRPEAGLNLYLTGYGKAASLYTGKFSSDQRIVSVYDTTVLYNGIDTCNHRIVEKKHVFNGQVCAVWHGDIGCPDDWYNNYSICTKCLRHVYVKETRRIETIKDEYETALEKLNKINPIK